MPGDRQTTWVMMLNMESRPVYIHKRTVLGHRTETDGEEVDVEDTEEEEVSDTRVLAADVEGGRPQKFDFDAQISQELPPHDRKAFRTTLEEFEGCFAKADDQLGRCNVTEHEIHLIPNARPIYQAPRPTSWKEQAILSKHTDDMLKKGVIERSSGPCARTLLAQKKNGTWRFCLDFRPLNGVNIFSVYPMPNIDGALTRLRGARIFSVMDLERLADSLARRGQGEDGIRHCRRGIPDPRHAVRVVHCTKHVPEDHGFGTRRAEMDIMPRIYRRHRIRDRRHRTHRPPTVGLSGTTKGKPEAEITQMPIRRIGHHRARSPDQR